jgi:hypothetical protein
MGTTLLPTGEYGSFGALVLLKGLPVLADTSSKTAANDEPDLFRCSLFPAQRWFATHIWTNSNRCSRVEHSRAGSIKKDRVGTCARTHARGRLMRLPDNAARRRRGMKTPSSSGGWTPLVYFTSYPLLRLFVPPI